MIRMYESFDMNDHGNLHIDGIQQKLHLKEICFNNKTKKYNKFKAKFRLRKLASKFQIRVPSKNIVLYLL